MRSLAELLSPALDPSDRRELDGRLLLSNLRRARVMAWFVTLLVLPLLADQLLRWKQVEESFGAYTMGVALLRVSWLAWALMVLVLTLRLPEQIEEIALRHRVFEAGMGLLGLLLAILQCNLLQEPRTGFTIYFMALFLLSSFIRYDLPKSIIVYLPAWLALLITGPMFFASRPEYVAQSINGTIMTFMALVVVRISYASAARSFQQMRIIERQKDELQELDKMKSGFLSGVSHELRTPLTSVLGFAKLIKREFHAHFSPLAAPDPKTARRAVKIEENLDIIVREGERLTRLINDVLDLTKIESGRTEWRDQTWTVGELVEQAVQAVSGEFAQRPGVKLEMQVEERLPPLLVDRDRLVQVMINLLNNASKFTVQGRVAILAKAAAGGGVRVEVSDTGPGMPPETLDKVFDQFYQVITGDTLSDKPKGTGLGLSICKQIVEHYKGRLWAESTLGAGSTFIFELPPSQKP